MFGRAKALLAGLCWLSSVAMLSTPAYAGLLYINGRLNPQLITKNGTTAPPGGMWSELQNNAGDTNSSNAILGISANQGRNHIADDFTIPADETWTIGFIDFFGFVGGTPVSPSPFISMNVQIWNGRPGDPGSTVIAGDLTTNVLTSSTDTMIFRQDNTLVPPVPPILTTRRIWKNRVTFSPGIKLSAGTYWIEWQSRISSSFGDSSYVPNTVEGMRGLAGWNARLFDVDTRTWIDLVDLGRPSTAAYVSIDFPFEINSAPVCGDTVAEVSEQCDDGNTTNGDGCDNNCTVTACGNGVITSGEVCDDGNMTNGDGCDNNCTVTACGNGVITAGEVCDDGNMTNGDGCDNNCTVTACGNGIQDDSEQCDDGNTIGGDGCSVHCAPEMRTGGAANAGGCAGGCKVSGGRADLCPLFFLIALAAIAPSSLRRKRQTL